MILITNNKEKRVDPSSYDKVIYLGLQPDKELESNEIVINSKIDKAFVNGFEVTLTGINKFNRACTNKRDLEESYKYNINQIVLNERGTNVNHETSTGELIWFVSKGGHLELDI